AGGNIFLVLQPRLPQVDVHVHQARAYRQPPGVDDLSVLIPEIAADDGQAAILDEDVHHAADATHGVHQSAFLDEKLHVTAPFRSWTQQGRDRPVRSPGNFFPAARLF